MEIKVKNFLSKLETKVAVNSDQVTEVHERIKQKVDALATNVNKTEAPKDKVEDLVVAKLHEDKLEEDEIRKRKTSIIVHELVKP